MNRKELNFFGTMKSVNEFLTLNQTHFANKPAMVAAHDRLKITISNIESNEQTQAIDTTIDTTLKEKDKETLINNTLKVAAAMSAVAASTSDTRLKMIANVSKTDLSRMRESNLATKTLSIHQAALSIATELAIWEVTQADIDSLDSDSSKFLQRAPTNRNIKAITMQAKVEIKIKIAEGGVLLRDTIDALMLPYKTINSTLHGQYLVARAIIDRSATRPGKLNDKSIPVM